jgi:hypothetical protein
MDARRRADHIRQRAGAPVAQPCRRDAATGLPVGDRHWPCRFSPLEQKWRILSQFFVVKAPVVRMRAVSTPGPQSIVPVP